MLRTLFRNTGTESEIEVCSLVFLTEKHASARGNPILARIS
jgi:hypothetical protein